MEYISLLELNDIYNIIKKNTRNKDKLFKFECCKNVNLYNIYNSLVNNTFVHDKYNIFLIYEPKARIIMSENMSDRIVNYYVAEKILRPLLEPKLIDTNVATRRGKGSLYGIIKLKKYINHMKLKYNNFYVLKCDIKKYFYSINHNILINKLNKIIKDKNKLKLIINIINSTNYNYINNSIDKLIYKEINYIKNNNKLKDKESRIKELESIPKYTKGKGLPIGNVTSQVLAIFYLNDLDHYIKEKLSIKCYIRYMDDFLLIHQNKEYLKECLNKIKSYLIKENLYLNNKTEIYSIYNSINFLGYRFKLNSKKKLLQLMTNKHKRNINNMLKNKVDKYYYLYSHYRGYYKYCNNKSFIYKYLSISKY